MTGSREPTGRAKNGVPRSYHWGIFLALLLGCASFAMSLLSSQVPATEGGAPHEQTDEERREEYRRDLHSYIWGISLALALTVTPFALVHWSVLPRFPLFLAIGVFALAQIVAHFRFFLHINPPSQKVDDLYLILFSTLILFVMVSGTVWIMANLATRMH